MLILRFLIVGSKLVLFEVAVLHLHEIHPAFSQKFAVLSKIIRILIINEICEGDFPDCNELQSDDSFRPPNLTFWCPIQK